MERSEPSLVPEWLRSNGGGSSIHHFPSSHSDGTILSSSGRSRSSKSISNSSSLHSPRLDRSSSSNSRRSSNSNGFSNHDKSSYALSYSSFSRNNRDRDRERSTIADKWDSGYSDPLRGMINGRAEDPLRRSKSSISSRQVEAPQRKFPTEIGNGGQKNQYNGVQKVSFEKDFPVLGFDERPKTPDIIRVSSPGLSRGIQSMSIGNSSSVGTEAWTSALAAVPSCAVSNGGALQPASSAFSSSLISVPASSSSSLNVASAQVHSTPQLSVQLQKDELVLAQSKKLIPLTPLSPKTMVLNHSDKLKPKTVGMSGFKNGVHQMSDLPKSSGMSLLKPTREKGSLKDIPSAVANGSSTGAPSLNSAPSKYSNNKKHIVSVRKPSTYSLNGVPVVDKRLSLAQLRSRNDFLNLMRKKSMTSSSADVDSSRLVSSAEDKQMACDEVTATENGKEKGDDDAANLDQEESPNDLIHPAEELAFLRALGWKDDEGDDEGLTEEEINAFVEKYMNSKSASKLVRGLQLKSTPVPDSQGL